MFIYTALYYLPKAYIDRINMRSITYYVAPICAARETYWRKISKMFSGLGMKFLMEMIVEILLSSRATWLDPYRQILKANT